MILKRVLGKTFQAIIFSCFGGALIDRWVLGSIVESICAPELCLNGSLSHLSIGVVLEDSSTRALLLPGNYSGFRDAIHTHAESGFAVYEQDGLVVTQTSPLIAYPRPLYQDQPRFLGGDSNDTIDILGSFLLAQDYQATFGVDGVPRITVHDSSPDVEQWNGLEGLELMSVESRNCPGGCGAGGNCNQYTSTCVCLPGYTGARCDSCASGYFGSDCQQCPNCDKSSGITCDDGTTGSGTCISLHHNNTQRSPLSLSQMTCNCLSGVCTGEAECLCSTGWTQSQNGTLCASCMAGFFLDTHGECVACGSACESCETPSGICKSCVKGFQVSKDDSTKCVPSSEDLMGGTPTYCNDGFNNVHNSTCLTCHPSCKSCFGPSASSCTQCFSNQALLSTGSVENNTLSASCVSVAPTTGVCSSPPNSLFIINQSKGKCDPAPRLCSSASIPGFSGLDPGSNHNVGAVCSACASGAFLLPAREGASEGMCVGVCPNGTYDDHRGRCASCPVGCSTCDMSSDRGGPGCMICENSSMLLSKGRCVQECPAGTFETLSANDTPQASKGAKVCSSCSASCGNCTQSPTTCRSCPKNRPAFDPATQTCALACEKGKFPDPNAGGRCALCQTSCETCSGPSPGDCLSCKPGDTLQEGKCRASACASLTTRIIPGWGICLEDLLATNSVVAHKGLPTWLVVCITLLLSTGLIAQCLVVWRLFQRKKRQEKTNQFETDLTTSDIKLHQLDGPIIQDGYQLGWNDDSMRPVLSPWPCLTPTPSVFKIKRKVVPTDNPNDDEDRESMSTYSQNECHHYNAHQNAIPELPPLPNGIKSDGSTARESMRFETSQHTSSHNLQSARSMDSFGFK